MGKLDAAAPAGAVVNGPEDAVLDWDAVDWRQVEDDVRRLRQRIFTASKAGDLRRVRNLQKLMLRSRANTLLSGPRWKFVGGYSVCQAVGSLRYRPQAQSRASSAVPTG
jgi:RNA-directed DNA polymerase